MSKVENSKEPKVTKEMIDLIKEEVSKYDLNWAKGIMEKMRENNIIQIRYRHKEGGMPLSVIYNITNGFITTPVLLEVFYECANEHLENLKKISA